MPDTTNDIAALLSLLERGGWERYRATAVALVAERDGLKNELESERTRFKAYRSASISKETDAIWRETELRERIDELEAASKPNYIFGALVAERNALRERVAGLESNQPADRDLRERLVCAALTGAMTQEGWRSRDAMAAEVVATADATLVAMRKGDGRE